MLAIKWNISLFTMWKVALFTESNGMIPDLKEKPFDLNKIVNSFKYTSELIFASLMNEILSVKKCEFTSRVFE